MKYRWLAFSIGAGSIICSAAFAAGPSTQPANRATESRGPATVLPDAPGAPVSMSLGEVYSSDSAGIAVRLPAVCRQVFPTPTDEIAQFSDEKGNWVLKLGRLTFAKPVPLTSGPRQATPGLLDSTVEKLK